LPQSRPEPGCAARRSTVLIGYLRLRSDDGADAIVQRQALAEAGCEQIVEDRISSAEDGEQAGLSNLLARLRPEDVLVVLQLDSLGRSPPELAGRVQQVTAAGAGLRSLAEAFHAAAPQRRVDASGMGRSETRRDSRNSRGPQRGSAWPARGRSPLGGRPPKLSPDQQAEIADEVLSGRSKAAAMARDYGVSAATVSRLLAARRSAAPGPWSSGPAGKGTATADRVAGVLPPSALDTRLAVVGTSGSGKTYAAKGLLERVMAGGGRVCVVDPLGVWWGLGQGADGAAPPFPVLVFGGLHADVPLDPGMAVALGRLIGTQPIACVVDVSDLGSASVRRFFMTAFTEALYASNTQPLHLVLDEADLWAPQRAQPEGQDLLGRVEEIVRRGRVRGFVPWLITQRPAVLHKDVLSQADILLSMKLTSSQDREAIGRWIEGQADRAEGRRILGALPRLARGEGWVWAPGNDVLARVRFPRIRTLDSSQTPRREVLAGTPRALAALDLSAIRQMLAGMAVDAIEERSPAPAAHAQVSDLERRLQQREAELAAARTHLARMEVETAMMQERLDRGR